MKTLTTEKNTTARILKRAEYIRTAKVVLKKDFALVKSETTADKYTVPFNGLLAVDCDCFDHQKRHHVCKHMEATERKLQNYKPRPKKESPLVAIYAAKFADKIVGIVDGKLQVILSADIDAIQAIEDNDLTAEENALFEAIGNDEIVVQEEMEAEVWTQEEITAIREAAKSPVVQAPKWENVPLNGSRDFSKMCLLNK